MRSHNGGVIHWIMVNLLGARLLKETDHLSPRIHKPSTAAQLGVGLYWDVACLDFVQTVTLAMRS